MARHWLLAATQQQVSNIQYLRQIDICSSKDPLFTRSRDACPQVWAALPRMGRPYSPLWFPPDSVRGIVLGPIGVDVASQGWTPGDLTALRP